VEVVGGREAVRPSCAQHGRAGPCHDRGNVGHDPGVSTTMTIVRLDTPPAVPAWDDALVAVYREHFASLVRMAYLVSGRADRAEEVVQDAFVRTHRAGSRVRDPLPYVRTAVLNGCRSLARRQKLERDRRPAPPEPVPLGADELWDALAVLTDRQRAAIVLRFYLDLPDAEIAAALDCREATVRTSVHRALAKLRKEIDR
jgi:DNA-directed RNA polymerase specialized sigma24 family protein